MEMQLDKANHFFVHSAELVFCRTNGLYISFKHNNFSVRTYRLEVLC